MERPLLRACLFGKAQHHRAPPPASADPEYTEDSGISGVMQESFLGFKHEGLGSYRTNTSMRAAKRAGTHTCGVLGEMNVRQNAEALKMTNRGFRSVTWTKEFLTRLEISCSCWLYSHDVFGPHQVKREKVLLMPGSGYSHLLSLLLRK